jgi:hypothetical protein
MLKKWPVAWSRMTVMKGRSCGVSFPSTMSCSVASTLRPQPLKVVLWWMRVDGGILWNNGHGCWNYGDGKAVSEISSSTHAP